MPTTDRLKRLAFRYLRMGAPSYAYNLEPIELAEIVMGIDRALTHPGRRAGRGLVVEVGVARGLTSRFIAEHIVAQGHDCDLVCIDTFSSFVPADVDHEVEHRGKSRSELSGFAYNDVEVWRRNFRDFDFVRAVEADVSTFDFGSLAPVNFCLLDVDLYLPTKAGLERLLAHMATGGVIVVDDVAQGGRWDGAHQAFHEFVVEHDLPHRLAGTKCGIIDVV